jgi:hypothetical protein
VTPSLFDLPVGLGDAARLAELVLDVCGAQPRPVTDDQRSRISARLAAVSFNQMRPLIGSLERDPVHPAACYACVDGIGDEPLLLRMAPSTTPSSGLFPKAILIGRTQIGGRELVLNAVPFGPLDADRIASFSEEVNPAFLPKPAGSRSLIVARSPAPAQAFPDAFAAFRRGLKSTGINNAAFELMEGQEPGDVYYAVVWSAIRAGWREGYALIGPTGAVVPGLKRKPFETGPEDARRVEVLPGDSCAALL